MNIPDAIHLVNQDNFPAYFLQTFERLLIWAERPLTASNRSCQSRSPVPVAAFPREFRCVSHSRPFRLCKNYLQKGPLYITQRCGHASICVQATQWGAVPAEQIVGFVHLDRYQPDSPIFIRRSFRKNEPQAFEYMFNVMSGMTPEQQ